MQCQPAKTQVVEYNPRWSALFRRETERIGSALGRLDKGEGAVKREFSWAVRELRLAISVDQFPLSRFAGLTVQPRYLLPAGMIITPY